ncbi:MAG: hypothetical protein AB7P78_08830 [Candidatus Binatia bacterium]
MTLDAAASEAASWWTVMLRVAVLLLCTVQLGATQCGRNEIPAEHWEFVNLPFRERPKALAAYPPKEQVDLYLSAMFATHPRQLELADVVAASGPAVLPIIIERIRRAERDFDKVNLIYVVERMQEGGYVPVTSDAQTMAVLQAEVSTIKDSEWRVIAEESLGRMTAAVPVGKATAPEPDSDRK